MIKRILYFISGATVLAVTSFYVHSSLLEELNPIRVSLVKVYLFMLIFSVLIYGAIELMSDYMPTQVGFIYLVTIFIKMGFFILMFKGVIFAEGGMVQAEKYSLVVPMMMFLFFEAGASFSLLNKQ